MKHPSLLQWMIAFSVLGAVDASYGLFQHFGPVGSGVCNWGGRISCDIVNKSVFSEFFGVPVALIGLLGYLTIAVIAWLIHYQKKALTKELLIVNALGLAVSLYLTFLEVYYLRAICPICITSQAVMITLTALSGIVWRKWERGSVIY